MVAYIASQTLTHNEIIPEDEQGANIWDILTQRAPIRETRQSAPFWDVPEQPGEDSDEGHHDYGYDDEGEEDDKDAFNTLESSAERVIHQATRPQAVPRTGNPIAGPERKDASFTKEGHQGSTLATNAPPAVKKTPTAVCGLGTRGTTRRTTRGHVECAQHLVSKDFTHWKITYFDHPDRQD